MLAESINDQGRLWGWAIYCCL